MSSNRIVSRAAAGFTLIELMVVVAIVAILASVAYPAYLESVSRSRRNDAKSVLLENAQWLERQYTVSGSYQKDGSGATISSSTLPIAEAPKSSATKVYTITLASTSSATAYTLQAAPKNGMANDKCGTFTLTNAGVKGLSGNTASVNDCWER